MSSSVNAISSAGLLIARQISSAYFDNPNVKAILLGGSVARGCADHYSDLELGVFWAEPPSTHERQAAIEHVGGELWTFDREPGNEHYGLSTLALAGKSYTGTAMISTQHMAIGDMERCLSEVIDHYDTSVGKQALISAIQHAIPLYGVDLIQTWQARARAYPNQLAIKVVQENLWFGPWFWPEAYIERDDRLVLHQHFLWVEHGLLKVLAGLNRIYYPSPEHKWMDELIGQMKFAPPDLSRRMKVVFRLDPVSGWQQLKSLIEDTITLVESHLPEVNQISLFKEHPEINTTWARQRWKSNSPYNLMEQIAASQEV